MISSFLFLMKGEKSDVQSVISPAFIMGVKNNAGDS